MDVVFRKEMDGVWEEMLQQTRRIRAGNESGYAAALAGAFSKVIFEPR